MVSMPTIWHWTLLLTDVVIQTGLHVTLDIIPCRYTSSMDHFHLGDERIVRTLWMHL